MYQIGRVGAFRPTSWPASLGQLQGTGVHCPPDRRDRRVLHLRTSNSIIHNHSHSHIPMLFLTGSCSPWRRRARYGTDPLAPRRRAWAALHPRASGKYRVVAQWVGNQWEDAVRARRARSMKTKATRVLMAPPPLRDRTRALRTAAACGGVAVAVAAAVVRWAAARLHGGVLGGGSLQDVRFRRHAAPRRPWRWRSEARGGHCPPLRQTRTQRGRCPVRCEVTCGPGRCSKTWHGRARQSA